MLRDKDHLYNVAVSMESRYAFCNLVSFWGADYILA